MNETAGTTTRLADGTVVEFVEESAVAGRPRYWLLRNSIGAACEYATKNCLHRLPLDRYYDRSEWGALVEVLPPPKAAKAPALPTEDKDRKARPVFTGPLMYFPHALLEVARVCKVGNDQHNPGQPMHWAREKSTDQMNTALRHMMDHGLGNQKDTDGTYHLAKAAWRILAELELAVERDLAAK